MYVSHVIIPGSVQRCEDTFLGLMFLYLPPFQVAALRSTKLFNVVDGRRDDELV